MGTPSLNPWPAPKTSAPTAPPSRPAPPRQFAAPARCFLPPPAQGPPAFAHVRWEENDKLHQLNVAAAARYGMTLEAYTTWKHGDDERWRRQRAWAKRRAELEPSCMHLRLHICPRPPAASVRAMGPPRVRVGRGGDGGAACLHACVHSCRRPSWSTRTRTCPSPHPRPRGHAGECRVFPAAPPAAPPPPSVQHLPSASLRVRPPPPPRPQPGRPLRRRRPRRNPSPKSRRLPRSRRDLKRLLPPPLPPAPLAPRPLPCASVPAARRPRAHCQRTSPLRPALRPGPSFTQAEGHEEQYDPEADVVPEEGEVASEKGHVAPALEMCTTGPCPSAVQLSRPACMGACVSSRGPLWGTDTSPPPAAHANWHAQVDEPAPDVPIKQPAPSAQSRATCPQRHLAPEGPGACAMVPAFHVQGGLGGPFHLPCTARARLSRRHPPAPGRRPLRRSGAASGRGRRGARWCSLPRWCRLACVLLCVMRPGGGQVRAREACRHCAPK